MKTQINEKINELAKREDHPVYFSKRLAMQDLLSWYIQQKVEEIEEMNDKWKEQIGVIPENTCPSINKVIADIQKYVDDVEYIRKNAHRYDTAEEVGKDLPDFGWHSPTDELDTKLRNDNEKLRELGKFWYEKQSEIVANLLSDINKE